MNRFLKDIRSLDKSAFSLTTGLRAAAFVIAPLIVGFAIKQPDLRSRKVRQVKNNDSHRHQD